MKLLTLETTRRLVRLSGQSIGMLPKELGEGAKTEDVLKVMETLSMSSETESGREDDWTIWIQ